MTEQDLIEILDEKLEIARTALGVAHEALGWVDCDDYCVEDSRCAKCDMYNLVGNALERTK